MSMSSHVVGFIPADENWAKMKEVYNACKKANIPVPSEVEKFFDYENPNNSPEGMQISLDKVAKRYNGEMEDGFEIEISKLPPNIKVIRFFNSY